MSTKQVTGVGQIGWISREDQLPADLPFNAWNVARNVRFKNRDVEAAKGWESVGSVPSTTGATLDFVAGGLSTWWLHYSDEAIYSVRSGYALTDVTGVSGPYSSGEWSITNFQGIPIATNNEEVPQAQFVPAGIPTETTDFIDLTNWPAADTCRFIATLGNFLVALDLTETGTRYKTKIRWSSPAAPGDLPASWDVTDPTTLAGDVVVGTSRGGFTAVAPMRDDLIIYQESGVGRLSYVGGNAVLRYRVITDKWGALGQHCVAPLSTGLHLVVTQNDIVLFDGNTEKSVAEGRVKRALFQLVSPVIDNPNGFRMFTYEKMSEVWFGIPNSDGDIQEVYIYNYEEDTWAGPRQTPPLRDFRYLPILDEASSLNLQLSWEQAALTPQLGTWSDWNGIPWGATEIVAVVGDFGFFGAGPDGDLYRLDYGYEHQGVQPYESDLIRQDLALGDDTNSQLLVAMYPRATTAALSETLTLAYWDEAELDATITWDATDWASRTWDEFFTGETPLEIWMGSQDAPGIAPDWREPRAFVYGRRKVATKARGVRHAVRFRSAKTAWRLSGYALEFFDSGRRGKTRR